MRQHICLAPWIGPVMVSPQAPEHGEGKKLTEFFSAQLLADAAAAGRGMQTKKVGHEEAKFSHDKLTDKNARWLFFQAAYEEILHETGGEFLN